MEIRVKNTWDEITWNEYEQLSQILTADIPSDYKSIHLISLLSGISIEDIERLPINQFQKLLPALDFLNKKPKTHHHKFEYIVNDREYVFKGKLDEITTSQYMDYRTCMNESQKDVVKLLSCFLIPKGHDYNDGYDIELVRSDIGDMSWLDVKAAAFFFRIQFAAFILILKSYLQKMMKKAKVNKKELKQVEESLSNMAYCLLYSKPQKIATLHSM